MIRVLNRELEVERAQGAPSFRGSERLLKRCGAFSSVGDTGRGIEGYR